MPAVVFTSVGETTDFTTIAGNVTDAADTTYVSGFRMRLNVDNPAVTASATKDAILADAGRRIVFWAKWSAFPSATRSFLNITDNAGNSICVLQLSSGGVLACAPVGATAVTGRTLDTTVRWRITVSYTITNTTVFTFRVYVNGVLDITCTAGTLTRTGSDRLQFVHNTNWPVSMTGDYSGIYVDDGSDLGDATASEVFFGYPTASSTFIDSCGDATRGLEFYSTTTAGVSISTLHPRTGARSLLLAGTAATSVAISKARIMCDAGAQGSAWVYMDAYPAAGLFSTIIGAFRLDGFAVLAVVVNSAGGIFVQPVTTAFLASGTHADDGTQTVPLNTLTRISWAYVVTGPSSYTVTAWVNGKQTASKTGSYGSLYTMWSQDFAVANRTQTSGINFWFDDVVVFPSTALADPGDIRVAAKRPFTNGTINGFTTQIGAGGSGYGTGHTPQVNELPLSETNGWSMIGAGSEVVEEYNIESKSAGEVGVLKKAIIWVKGWIFAKSLAPETGKIVVAGTQTNIALTSTATMFTQDSATPTTYPAGTGTDIGMVTSTDLTTVSLYEAGILVAFKVPESSQLFITG